MQFVLTKKPKGARLITGFPSVGLVSTIATKFLIEHLQVEIIGTLEGDEFLPLTAIHNGRVISPITLYYNKEYNLIVLQSLTDVTGIEWKLAKSIEQLCKDLQIKELITLDGTPTKEEHIKVFYFSEKGKIKNLDVFNDGMIMGVTAALLLTKPVPMTNLFAEVHSSLPDSEAAAHIVEALDHYLNLKVDFKPLLEAARKFEENLKVYMQKMREAQNPQASPKQYNYIG